MPLHFKAKYCSVVIAGIQELQQPICVVRPPEHLYKMPSKKSDPFAVEKLALYLFEKNASGVVLLIAQRATGLQFKGQGFAGIRPDCRFFSACCRFHDSHTNLDGPNLLAPLHSTGYCPVQTPGNLGSNPVPSWGWQMIHVFIHCVGCGAARKYGNGEWCECFKVYLFQFIFCFLFIF